MGKTLVIVISKSGGTKETRNGMLEIQAAYEEAGLTFANQAVAVTGEDSNLDQVAKAEGWMQRFHMWDWVGGRTSVTSAVGLLPAALQGFDIDDLAIIFFTGPNKPVSVVILYTPRSNNGPPPVW